MSNRMSHYLVCKIFTLALLFSKDAATNKVKNKLRIKKNLQKII